jgi:dTDP-4-amino-4,6-dideoxygalactose transaminase
MGLMLIGIEPEDEVIMPSFTFTSATTAITLHGGTPIFIDSHPDTLNMDEDLIEGAITPKTKAIMPMHYGGLSCNMEKIMAIAKKHKLIVLDDAAQCIGAYYNNKPVGSEGHMSAFSFHETKNIICGEGGMLCINDEHFIEKAEIARDKGTNRQQFFRGTVDKYSWQEKGSSYLMSELQAAFLSTQLEKEKEITKNRLETWQFYHNHLKKLEEQNKLQRPITPEQYKHNAHLYYILLPTEHDREKLQKHLKEKGITASPHYVPLHSSKGGKKFGRLGSKTKHVDDFANRLLRLPFYYGLKNDEKSYVIEQVEKFLI